MNDPDKKLDRLLAAARTARPPEDNAPPLGFATRVVARAFAAPVRSALRVWESLSWKFLAAACAVTLTAALGAGLNAPQERHEVEMLVDLADASFETAFLP